MRRLCYKPVIVLIAFFTTLFLSQFTARAQTISLGNSLVYLPLIANNFDPVFQWGNVQPLTLSPAPAVFDNPFLVIDHQGRPHVFWDSSTSPTAFVYHTYLTDQGWASPEPIAQTLGYSTVSVPPVVDSDGRIHVLWQNELTTSGPYRLVYANWNAGQWSAEEELLGSTNYELNGSLRLDNQNRVQAALFDPSGSFPVNTYYQIWSSSGWSAPQSIPAMPKLGLVDFTEIAWLSRLGGLSFYRDVLFSLNDTRLNYARWQNGAYVVKSKTIDTLLNNRYSILDGMDNLHLTISAPAPIPGASVTGLYHQCLTSQPAWLPETIESGQVSINSWGQAVDNSTGYSLVWLNNGISPELNLEIWDGCVRSHTSTINLPAFPDPYNSWGFVQSMAFSDQPKKVCVLISGYLDDDKYAVICAMLH